MARLIGVEVPDQKKIGIALRYIYGIGPTTALQVCEKASVDPNVRAKDLNDEQLSHLTTVLQGLSHRRRSAPRSADEHQTLDEHQLLPRHPAQEGPAGSRSAHFDERAHAQRPAQDGRRRPQPRKPRPPRSDCRSSLKEHDG